MSTTRRAPFRILVALFSFSVLLLGWHPALHADAKRIARAKELRQQAKVLLKAGKLAEAESKLKEAIKAWPAYPVVYNELGVIAFQRKDYNAAVRYFQQAATYQKDNSSAWRNLGVALQRLKRYAEAVAAFKRYVALKPSDPDGWWAYARAAELGGDVPVALAGYRRYLELETRSDQAKYRQIAKRRLAKLEAKAPKRPTVAKKPKRPTVVKTTTTAPRPKRPPTTTPPPVVTSFDSPGTSNVAPELREADALFRARRYREARARYEQHLARSPKNANALYRLGVVRAVLGDLKGAIATWYRLLELRPRNRVVRRSITQAQIRLAWQAAKTRGRMSRRQSYRESLRDVRRYGLAGRPGDAELALSALIAMQTRNPRFYWLRGEMRLQLGLFQKAERDFHLARALRPLWEFPAYALAELHLRLGDNESALRYLRIHRPSANNLEGLIVKRQNEYDRELIEKTTPGR
ncbi:MAG: tetratricopeptide repeat protein [Myxococcales bacterium]|nr:tetratricopeptide repeat protein [Myxococcales bacterium]